MRRNAAMAAEVLGRRFDGSQIHVRGYGEDPAAVARRGEGMLRLGALHREKLLGDLGGAAVQESASLTFPLMKENVAARSLAHTSHSAGVKVF